MGGDSCLGQAMLGAAFGGVFGLIASSATSTFSPSMTMNSKLATSYIGKTSAQYSIIATTFMGASCASEGFTAQKGAHNSMFGGVAVGVVTALLKQNLKQGLAIGGMSALCMGAYEYSGGSMDARQEKDLDRFKFHVKTEQ